MRPIAIGLAALLCLLGCGDEQVELLVEVKTDFVPGVEFDRVVVVLLAATPSGTPEPAPLRMSETSVRVGESFLEGRRVAELGDLERGSYGVRGELFLGSEFVAERTRILRVDGDAGLTLLLTRDCLGLRCPLAADPERNISCVGGRCVDPQCAASGDAFCPPPECAVAGDCEPAASCSAIECAEGLCLYGTVSGACGGGACDPDLGCVGGDGGVPDGGAPDGGVPDGGVPDGGAPDAPTIDAGGAPWLDVAWGFRKPIDFLGARVPSDQLDFPVFVSIAADADLSRSARSDGLDLVFTADDGVSPLSHEIERFDATTGRLDAWVRLPTLSSTADTRAYLYYGNSAAVASAAPEAVWDGDYVGVWHLSQVPGPSAGMLDSTRSSNDLSSAGAMDASNRRDGLLGWSIAFDGTDDQLSGPVSASLAVSSRLTISAWALPSGWQDNSGAIAARSTMEGSTNHDYFIRAGMNDLNFGIYTVSPHGITDGAWDTVGAWHHVAGVYDGTTMTLYFDGVAVSSNATTGTVRDSDRPFHIGSWGVPDTTRSWLGQIDEVRVSSVARSPDWIRTGFNNQSDPSSFMTVGPEESR